MTETFTDTNTLSLVVASFGALLEAAFVPYGLATDNWLPAQIDLVVIGLGVAVHAGTSKWS